MSETNEHDSDEISVIDREVIKVLLVDDQTIVAEALRRMLEDEPGIEFFYCKDPQKAVEMAVEICPTTILQDILMPDIDGMTLVRCYRNHALLKETPVIVLSSKEDPADKSEAFQSGASDYLVKLPDKVELIARILAHSRSFLASRQRDQALIELRNLKKELEEKNAKLELLSSQDGLTGIANRRSFDESLANEWRRSFRVDSILSLLLVDIDYFKPFNDNYGHQGGDDCLIAVTKAMQIALKRPGDYFARYGGEEFAIILPDTEVQGAKLIAEVVRKSVVALGMKHEHSCVADYVTISIGVATMAPRKGGSADELVARSDNALYKAKESGRNRFVCADDISTDPAL